MVQFRPLDNEVSSESQRAGAHLGVAAVLCAVEGWPLRRLGKGLSSPLQGDATHRGSHAGALDSEWASLGAQGGWWAALRALDGWWTSPGCPAQFVDIWHVGLSGSGWWTQQEGLFSKPPLKPPWRHTSSRATLFCCPCRFSALPPPRALLCLVAEQQQVCLGGTRGLRRAGCGPREAGPSYLPCSAS